MALGSRVSVFGSFDAVKLFSLSWKQVADQFRLSEYPRILLKIMNYMLMQIVGIIKTITFIYVVQSCFPVLKLFYSSRKHLKDSFLLHKNSEFHHKIKTYMFIQTAKMLNVLPSFLILKHVSPFHNYFIHYKNTSKIHFCWTKAFNYVKNPKLAFHMKKCQKCQNFPLILNFVFTHFRFFYTNSV